MINKPKIKFGVIGAGKIGNYHIKTLSRMPEVELVGICDSNLLRAQMIAWRHNCVAYKNYLDLLPQIEAVIVAVPTEYHAEISLRAMEQGIHCMVEKPITNSVEDARALLEISDKKNVVLQVGHVERFNPAVVESFKHIKNPRFISIERLGPYDPRIAGIGVILDLMIHDLDILLTIMDSPIESFEAIGASILSNYEDIANVRIRFKSGCVADITASRVTLEKTRRMRIYQEDKYISVDFISARVKIYAKKNPVIKTLKDIEIIYPKVEKREPISEELYHFIDCINNTKKPLASGERGLSALRLALKITDELKKYELASRKKHRSKSSSLFQSIGDIGKVASLLVEETFKNTGIDKT